MRGAEHKEAQGAARHVLIYRMPMMADDAVAG